MPNSITASAMQRDTDSTFGQIHGSRHSFLKSVEDIIEVALVECDKESSIQLRFITTIKHGGARHTETNPACYLITEPHEHKSGMPYISVSYCWAHKQSLNGAEIPHYQILNDRRSRARPIACPPLVFHRAMRFARFQRCRHVWIDQECIRQDDPVDVERHLQVMHRVYKESERTVAVLATPILDEYSLESLLKVTHSHTSLSGRDIEIATITTLNLLVNISTDPWFSRTWAFQEKHCASSLYILIPIARFNVPSYFKKYLLGNELENSWDFCLPIQSVGVLLTRLRQGRFAASIANQWTSNSALSFEDVLDHLGIWFNNVGLPTNGDRALTWGEDHHLIHGAFGMLEKCENRVVADRISIFGNICDFPYRLLSNRLDHPEYSCSTCVMALLLANFYPTPKQRAEAIDRFAWHTKHHNIWSMSGTGLFEVLPVTSDLDKDGGGTRTGNTTSGWARFLAISFIASITLLQLLTVINVLLS